MRANTAGWGSAEVVSMLIAGTAATIAIAALVIAGCGASMALPAAQNAVMNAAPRAELPPGRSVSGCCGVPARTASG